MTLRDDLLELVGGLPATDTADGRRALLLTTGFAYLGIGLDFAAPSAFFSGLLAELGRHGALLAFLDALLDSPYGRRCGPELAGARERAAALDPAALAAVLAPPEPVPSPAEPDPALLAASVVLYVLAPDYPLDPEIVGGVADGPAPGLAGSVARAVDTALAGDPEASDALAEFRQMLFGGEDLIALLRARLAVGPALREELSGLLAAEPDGLAALGESGRQRLSFWYLVEALPAAIGPDAARRIRRELGAEPEMAMAEPPEEPAPAPAPKGLDAPKGEVTQDVETVQGGGAVVGTVTGEAVITGGGASIGDVHAGGDVVGRDQVVHGDKVGRDQIALGGVTGNVNIYMGTPETPAGPLVEERIRLDVAAPPAAELDRPFDLAVAVRQPEAPPLAVEDLTQVKSEEGSVFRHQEDDVLLYRIEVTAANCDVIPAHNVLKLRPRANSVPCYFQITPHRAGRQSIVVTAFQEDDAIAAQTRLKIEVQVPVT